MEVTQTETDNEQHEKILEIEIILYDVLYNIFSYLNICDLHRASRVCKSWYQTAKIEMLKRGPQVMVLQALEDHVATGFSNTRPINENEVVDDFMMSLRIKPRAGLFFTDGKYPATAITDSVTLEICTTHQWTQPQNSFNVAIEASGINVNERRIGGEKNISAAVFLPDFPTVNYTYTDASSSNIAEYFKGRNSMLTNITNKLFASDTEHTCFLIFIYNQWDYEPSYANYHNRLLDMILDTLKTRYAPGTYSLWGGAIRDIFLTTKDKNPSYLSISFFAMAISGSSVKSWSIALKTKCSDSEIEEKLQNFKKHICVRSSSVAFLMLPTGEDGIDRSKIDIFKNIFPTVTLLSIFNTTDNFILSVDTLSDESNPGLKHTNSYAYLILSYKL